MTRRDRLLARLRALEERAGELIDWRVSLWTYYTTGELPASRSAAADVVERALRAVIGQALLGEPAADTVKDLVRHVERGWAAFFSSDDVGLVGEQEQRAEELAALLEQLEPTPADADLAYL